MKPRRFEGDDVTGVLAIQASSPEASQWSRGDYERVARGEMQGWVVESREGIGGFVVARQIFAEVEIMNLAVIPDARHCGFGTALLKEALEWGKVEGATRAFVEVRASNLAALRFYQGHRFEVNGRRPRYYTAPVEDALLLSLVLRQ